MAASNGSEFFELGVESEAENTFSRPSNAEAVAEDEEELRWAAIERLPSQQRSNFALVRRTASNSGGGGGEESTDTVDVRKLDRFNRELVVRRALATTAQDNFQLLSGIKERLDKVDLEVPKVEVRFEKLNISADVMIGSRALPTLVNYSRDMFEHLLTKLMIFRPKRHALTILNNISGVVKPGRMTLLLGPPGSGKSTLLRALAGKLETSLKKSGTIKYNDHEFNEFFVQRASAYIGQTDNHIAELTVRETLDFAARCQGSSEGFSVYMKDLTRLEAERNIRPRPEIDAYMKLVEKKHSVSTDYILKVLGLDVCSDTLVGNDMLRGVSGGQRKRVTTGEMVVGPPCPETFDLFDDLILLSEGNLIYHGPRSEVLEFFESLGFRLPPRKNVADFLQEVTSRKDQGQYWGDHSKPYEFVPVSEIAEEFRKSRYASGFILRVLTRLSKLLYGLAVVYYTVDSLPELEVHQMALGLFRTMASIARDMIIANTFGSAALLIIFLLGGFILPKEMIKPWWVWAFWVSPLSYGQRAISVNEFTATRWMERTTVGNVSLGNQILHLHSLPSSDYWYWLGVGVLLAYAVFFNVTVTVALTFLNPIAKSQTIVPSDNDKEHIAIRGNIKKGSGAILGLHPTDVTNGELYLSCLFFGLVHMMFNGFSELPLMIFRLPVFYKQRDNLFHPAWAWSLSSFILRVPYSVIEAVVWSCVVYYTVGFAPGVGRFFRFMFLLFSVHQMALGLFRTMASIARDMIIANTFGSAALLIIFLLGGFILPKEMIKPWWVWAFWVSPLSYGQRAISVNEFTATRWMERTTVGNVSLGNQILHLHSLPSSDYWYWLGVGVLLAYAVFFNVTVTVALTFLNPIAKSQTIVPSDNDKEHIAIRGQSENNTFSNTVSSSNDGMRKKGMILPFQPLTMTFHNVNYFVDMPKEMSSQGIPETRLQLLSNVSGVFSPGVLTALMGSSGAGKTTLMDVLAGRKTGGYIEGDIRISGHPKEQKSFARISGYVEQSDIHSPQVTVIESLWFSSFLRLPKEVNEAQRKEFVEEVMQLVELGSLRHALVGLPGSSGLSTEQRKRLTIAVELVANPSIIFMDEPTSGLDARAAAIVMRTVRNTVDTGRTVVCTIHQPSIEIFEAFDELLLMKRGGRVIYGGKLGERSQTMIDYFQSISGVTPISDGYNPATWMLEISTPAMEENIRQDFAMTYQNSQQYRNVEASIQTLSIPLEKSEPLKFNSTYSKDSISQFRICLWKQNLVYWRSPAYNAVRLFFTTISAIIIGTIFWDVGSRRDSTQNLFVVLGALYASVMFLGVNNSSSVQPVISIERTVFYREKAAGMYSPFPFAFAQGLVEIPYILLQTIIYGIITYFMINFERAVGKFFLYLLFMFLTFTYFTFYGMMSIPGWWIWFYYICPIAWTLRGIITSQLGDVETRIVGPGFDGSVKEFINVRFGYDSGMLGVTVAVLVGFSVLFFAVFAISVRILNFQKR
ncbi:ABC transporter g family member 31 [Phtheirospermum japonicum]|uniref:ABC transporter g family member 31 n=1 Tax=Phtheirospermum japonicum TaxID=374723 RepID=A0A830B4P8_9LAMI|nr:ABC transporter g family member 31 [Phtheirospermum japonicum]